MKSKIYHLIRSLLICFVFLSYKADDFAVTPSKRAHHAMVYDAKEQKVVMIGGSTPEDGGSAFTFYNDIWNFDGTRWTHQGSYGDKRSGLSLAYDPLKGHLVSMGGFANNQSLSDLRILSDNKWVTIMNDPATATTDGGFVHDVLRDRFVAFGGSFSREKMNSDTWEWDRQSWIKKNIKSPDPRMAFAMVYDTKRMKTVLFGGMGETPGKIFGDTWEYDGQQWIKVATEGPSARMAMGYAYDAKRGLFLIFGGTSGAAVLSDTWGWDGKSWRQLGTHGPTPRVMGYMAYNLKRDKVVLFGGRLKWPNDTNDTWEWDGTAWSEVKL